VGASLGSGLGQVGGWYVRLVIMIGLVGEIG
jgi:hypothetical protein